MTAWAGGQPKNLIAYKLVAVYENDNLIANAAMMECCLTGEGLSGHGGGGMFLSPTIVDKIRRGKIEIIDWEKEQEQANR